MVTEEAGLSLAQKPSFCKPPSPLIREGEGWSKKTGPSPELKVIRDPAVDFMIMQRTCFQQLK